MLLLETKTTLFDLEAVMFGLTKYSMKSHQSTTRFNKIVQSILLSLQIPEFVNKELLDI